jgi:hypothetical protein
MDAEGDYPEVVRQYADVLAAGGTSPSAKDDLQGYQGALGCR